jgi:ribosomal protein S12 methylthiotransferase accessory factor
LRLLGAGPVLVDRHYGPITEAVEERLGGAEPPWWVCTTRLARYPVGTLFTPSPVTSGGASLDAADARAKAFGEAFERYSGLNCWLPTVSATLREGTLLDHWPRCAPDEQSPPSFRTLPADVPLTQVETRRLADGRAVLVPAGFVLVDPQLPETEPRVTLPNSTGLAFHPHLHEAIWRGLCEVVERDALMTLWWIHRPAPRIDIDGPQVPYPLAERIMRLRQAGVTPELYDMTTEIEIPAVLCVLTAPRYPYLVAGSAAHDDAGRACTKALDEAMLGRFALQLLRTGAGARNHAQRPNEHAAGILANALLYAGIARPPALDFLSRPGTDVIPYGVFSGRSVTRPTDQASLSQFAAHLEQENAITILWAEVTCPEVAAYGSVVHVIIPELVPLSFDHDIRWLGTERLLARSGVKNASKAAFFAEPHPFA